MGLPALRHQVLLVGLMAASPPRSPAVEVRRVDRWVLFRCSGSHCIGSPVGLAVCRHAALEAARLERAGVIRWRTDYWESADQSI